MFAVNRPSGGVKIIGVRAYRFMGLMSFWELIVCWVQQKGQMIVLNKVSEHNSKDTYK